MRDKISIANQQFSFSKYDLMFINFLFTFIPSVVTTCYE